jgi:hypothetical protein
MPGTLIQAEFTYNSGSAPNLYRFTIVSNSVGEILVRAIEDPYGAVLSPYTQIPQSVAADISAAMGQVENLLALTSAVNGTLTFAAETEKSVTFASPLADTTYRVVLSPSVFAPFRITNKTTAGFTISAGAAISGTVGYDVLV